MAHEDSNQTVITPDYIKIKNNDHAMIEPGDIGMSETRWNEYRALFLQVGTSYGIRYGKPSAMTIPMREYEGYIYLESPLDLPNPKETQFVQSKAECRFDKGQTSCNINLTKNWYQYYWD